MIEEPKTVKVEKFQTKSLNLAAAMIALGAEITQVDKTDPKHMEFYLEKKSPEFQSAILQSAVVSATAPIVIGPTFQDWEAQYASDTLMVVAPRFAAALQRLKSIIHSI
jgi:hypothetical protein